MGKSATWMGRLLAAAALLAASGAADAAAVNPTKLVIFGDSFIDAGNIAIATGGVIPDPALGYWRGRFSEGPTWADYLGFASLGYAAGPSLAGGTNFAFGGARGAGDDLRPEGAIPGLPTQGAMFVSTLGPGNPFDPDALYIINFGNNDVNAIQSGDTEGMTIPEYQAAYVNNMVGAVQALAGAGAHHILLAGVPNPLETEGQVLQAMLDAALDAAEPALPGGTTLYRFDYFNFFLSLLADPTQYGLPADLDFTTPCLVAKVPGPGIDCTGYLSFDGTHVTRAVQQAIAVQMARQVGLAVVPEPASWALMISGFGLVGLAVRRRKAATAVRLVH